MKFKVLACRLEDWLWSSYLGMVGDARKLGWLLYMIKPERLDFSGFITTKEVETTDCKTVVRESGLRVFELAKEGGIQRGGR